MEIIEVKNKAIQEQNAANLLEYTQTKTSFGTIFSKVILYLNNGDVKPRDLLPHMFRRPTEIKLVKFNVVSITVNIRVLSCKPVEKDYNPEKVEWRLKPDKVKFDIDDRKELYKAAYESDPMWADLDRYSINSYGYTGDRDDNLYGVCHLSITMCQITHK